VASSTRAATLHYCCNDREIAWGPVKAEDKMNIREIEPQVLLIDAGCEWNWYASDSEFLATVVHVLLTLE
jgi:Xaa-Pro dipeptidase